jgi:hypothetical protein
LSKITESLEFKETEEKVERNNDLDEFLKSTFALVDKKGG